MASNLRVYMSYDLEHDQDLHDLLVTHSRSCSSFTIAHRSEAGAMSEQWDARQRSRIEGADEVIVICGEHSDDSPRMSAELRMAQAQDKPILLLWGRRSCMCKKPLGAKPEDGMYSWTREILQEQVQATLRRNRPAPIPDGMKRQAPSGR